MQGSDEMPFITACKVPFQISGDGALGESVLQLGDSWGCPSLQCLQCGIFILSVPLWGQRDKWNSILENTAKGNVQFGLINKDHVVGINCKFP